MTDFTAYELGTTEGVEIFHNICGQYLKPVDHRRPYWTASTLAEALEAATEHEATCPALAARACDHEGTERIKKYDGGRRPLLCGGCYEIVGWW